MTIAVPDYHTWCNIVSFSDNIVTMVSLKLGMDLQIVNWAYHPSRSERPLVGLLP